VKHTRIYSERLYNYICFLKKPYIKQIADETVSDDGNGTLPERVTVEIVAGVEHAPHQGEAHDGVQVEHHQTQDPHPHQRTTCQINTLSSIRTFHLSKARFNTCV